MKNTPPSRTREEFWTRWNCLQVFNKIPLLQSSLQKDAAPEVAILHPSLPHLGGRWRRSRRMRGVSGANDAPAEAPRRRKEPTKTASVPSKEENRENTPSSEFFAKNTRKTHLPPQGGRLRDTRHARGSNPPPSLPPKGEGTLHTPRPR